MTDSQRQLLTLLSSNSWVRWQVTNAISIWAAVTKMSAEDADMFLKMADEIESGVEAKLFEVKK